ncbi:MmcQ/YjbR family DNA-binding protein [uncultured Hymenobacter sp.]|uniref:MmcQ/YjbR family DNA-binding protein n=1 Tax=uncultured Hymenobacter sp. TaxID=170016 RepID=UPI0035C99454
MLNIEEFRDYCLALPGTTEATPFDLDTLVFKVGGKIFALTSIATFGSVNLKCEPELAAQLREEFDYVRPGFHMNKKHWNTVLIGTGVTAAQLREWTRHSYELVRAALPRTVRTELETAENV